MNEAQRDAVFSAIEEYDNMIVKQQRLVNYNANELRVSQEQLNKLLALRDELAEGLEGED